MRVRFGECVLDSITRELLVGRETVHLEPKAFDLLAILIENRPRALSKSGDPREALARHLRLRGNVDESSGGRPLRDRRRRAREALDPDRVPFRVRLLGLGRDRGRDEEEIPRAAFAFRLYQRSREFALEEGENVLGRDPGVNVFLDYTSVSRRHARIVISGEGAQIEDLQSKNGTFVRGARIEAPSRIADGDEIQLGSVPLTFRVFPLSGSTETASRR